MDNNNNNRKKNEGIGLVQECAKIIIRVGPQIREQSGIIHSFNNPSIRLVSPPFLSSG